MKQKQWIKAAAIFFGLMIVLTVFSRATASVTKAKVTVAKAGPQTITHTIRLDGTVEAKDHSLQYVPAGLMVKSVRVSPGQTVQQGDVLFTIDTGKLQEKIGDIEEEMKNAEQRNSLTVSRAEEALQDVRSSAEQEKTAAYRAWEEASAAYHEYMDTRHTSDQAGIQNADGSGYDEAAAGELESAVDAAREAYEAVAREQDRLVEAAEDSLRQTKEDLTLDQEGRDLEDSLTELRPFLENEGQYLAEYPGVVGKVFVKSGTETVEGVAVMIADASAGVRFVAPISEEDSREITEYSEVTLSGENMEGREEAYVLSAAVTEGNSAGDSGDGAGYSLSADIPGDLYPVGSRISVTVDNQSGEYATCLPVSCLRQNGNYQYFIYVVQEQETVFGQELTAGAMPVTVLDKNEQYAAVEETVSGDVVVSTNKELTDGSRVRITE